MGWLTIGLLGLAFFAFRGNHRRLGFLSLLLAFYFDAAELVVALVARPVSDLIVLVS